MCDTNRTAWCNGLRRHEGKVAVVTGASTGIGRACALRLANEGASIVCIDLCHEGNEATAALCREHGSDALALTCDVSSEVAVAATFAEVEKRCGQVDTLVCSAGIMLSAPIADVSMAQWKRILEVNLTGTFLCNRAVVRTMIRQRSGSIINLSSISGSTNSPEMAPNSTAKAGLLGFTKAVAMDLAPYGITANVICPGNIRTEMIEQVSEKQGRESSKTVDDWYQNRAKEIPLRRIGMPEDVAALVSFLASNDAQYITGQSMVVDGGSQLR